MKFITRRQISMYDICLTSISMLWQLKRDHRKESFEYDVGCLATWLINFHLLGK